MTASFGTGTSLKSQFSGPELGTKFVEVVLEFGSTGRDLNPGCPRTWGHRCQLGARVDGG
jgi:hypothetical protein